MGDMTTTILMTKANVKVFSLVCQMERLVIKGLKMAALIAFARVAVAAAPPAAPVGCGCFEI